MIVGPWLAVLRCPLPQVQELLLGSQYGGTKTHSHWRDIRDLVIPLPAVSEQHRIVATISEGRRPSRLSVGCVIDRSLDPRRAQAGAHHGGRYGRDLRMSPGALGEQAFEDRVEYELLQRGWARARDCTVPSLGWIPGSCWSSSARRRCKKWNRLIELHGGDQDTAQRQFALRVASEIDARGVLDVLRQGVKDRGVQIDLAYFRPGHTLAADALDEYNSERADRRAAAALQRPGPGAVGGHGVLRQRAAGRDRRAEEPEYRAERRARHRAVPATGTRTTCSSPSGPWCTSRSTRTGPSSRRG